MSEKSRPPKIMSIWRNVSNLTHRKAKAWKNCPSAAAAFRRWFIPLSMFVGLVLCIVGLVHLIVGNNTEVRLGPVHVIFAISLALCSVALSAVAWRCILQGVGGGSIAYREALAQVGLTLVGKYVPGKVSGLAARVLANQNTYPASTVIKATFLEQGGGVAAALCAGVVAWVSADSVVAGAWTLLVACLCAVAAPQVIRWLSRVVPRIVGMPPDSNALGIAFLTLGLQWLALLLLTMVLTDMVTAAAHDSMVQLRLAGIYAISVVAGQLAFVFPGGIGPREAAFALWATDIVGAEQAIAIALVLRIATTFIDLVGGVGYLLRPKKSR